MVLLMAISMTMLLVMAMKNCDGGVGVRVTVDVLQELCRRYPADMDGNSHHILLSQSLIILSQHTLSSQTHITSTHHTHLPIIIPPQTPSSHI